MNEERVFQMAFADVYPHYVKKAERKQRTKAELDEVLCWLTGHTARSLAQQIERRVDLRTFFDKAPKLHPNASKITGTICGIRIEAIENPLMQKVRWMDKLVDELAKGKPLAKILRA